MLYSLGNLHVCLIIITTTSQIHKSWSLHDLNSARTRTGVCITQTQKDSRMEELQVESQTQSQPKGTGKPTTTFEF